MSDITSTNKKGAEIPAGSAEKTELDGAADFINQQQSEPSVGPASPLEDVVKQERVDETLEKNGEDDAGKTQGEKSGKTGKSGQEMLKNAGQIAKKTANFGRISTVALLRKPAEIYNRTVNRIPESVKLPDWLSNLPIIPESIPLTWLSKGLTKIGEVMGVDMRPLRDLELADDSTSKYGLHSGHGSKERGQEKLVSVKIGDHLLSQAALEKLYSLQQIVPGSGVELVDLKLKSTQETGSKVKDTLANADAEISNQMTKIEEKVTGKAGKREDDLSMMQDLVAELKKTGGDLVVEPAGRPGAFNVVVKISIDGKSDDDLVAEFDRVFGKLTRGMDSDAVQAYKDRFMNSARELQAGGISDNSPAKESANSEKQKSRKNNYKESDAISAASEVKNRDGFSRGVESGSETPGLGPDVVISKESIAAAAHITDVQEIEKVAAGKEANMKIEVDSTVKEIGKGLLSGSGEQQGAGNVQQQASRSSSQQRR